MRELIVLGLVLLVTANTVDSGAIYYRRYRELELPIEGAQAAAESLPAESYVAELRKDQIPVQVVEAVEPVLIAKPLENLRSVEPEIAVVEAEPAAVITNEIIPEKLAEKLEEKLESVRAIEQVVEQAEELPLALPAVESVAEAIVKQEEQQLRNLEPETSVLASALTPVLLVEEAAELQKEADLPLEKKLLPEALSEALPEALPAAPLGILSKEPLVVAIAEELKPIETEIRPELKAIKEDKPIVNALPEVPAVKEAALPIIIESQPEVKALEENVAPVELQPAVKALKDDEPALMDTLKKEEITPEAPKVEQLLEKKEALKELKELKEEKLENIQEAIKEELKEKLDEAVPEVPKESDELVPSAKQADTADPAPTTARPPQPGFIQQLVQNTPLGQLFNTFNGNNQAASDENSPAATATTFIQAIQNTTSQITNSIQQGFQQQLQSLQTTFSGQPAQQAAASDAAPAASTARPQGPLQSIVTQFLGNGGQQQPASPQPAGPLQGIINLFGGNRPNTAAAATPVAAASSSTPAAAESLPANDEPASSESAAVEASPEIARDSVESVEVADDSQEETKPDEIVVSDDDSHE